MLRPGPLRPESVADPRRATCFGAEPDEASAAACHEATGGNPLYLRALLITLAATGCRRRAESARRACTRSGPSRSRAPSRSGSRACPPEAGRARAGDRGARATRRARARRRARRARPRRGARGRGASSCAPTCCGSSRRSSFTHPVVRAAVYEAIGALERAEAHRRAAGLLADGGRRAGARGRRTCCSCRPRRDPFVVALLRDGRASARSRAALPSEAVGLPAAGARRAARAGRARRGARRARARPSAASTCRPRSSICARRVELIEEPQRYADVALELGRALALRRLRQRRGDRGLPRARSTAPVDAARPTLVEVATAELINASWAEAHVPRRREGAARGVRDDASSPAASAATSCSRCSPHCEVRRGADRERAAASSPAARSPAARSSSESTQGIYYALDALRAAGELDAALAGYDSALAAARRRGDLLDVGGLLGFRGWLLLDRGDLRAAEPDVRESIEFSAEHGTPVHVMYSAVFLSDYLLERGELDEAERVLARAGLPEQLPENFHFAIFLGARGRLRLAQRKPRGGARRLRGAPADRRSRSSSTNPAEWPWRTGAATALLALGRDRRGARARRRGARARPALGRRRGRSASRCGRSASPRAAPRASERLREAVDVLAPLDRAARAREGARRARRRAAAPQRARRGARAAPAGRRRSRSRCGATALVERANEELAATGARPRKVVAERARLAHRERAPRRRARRRGALATRRSRRRSSSP